MKGMICKILAAISLAVMVLPLTAGEGYKCEASAQECVNHMAKKMADKGWLGVEYDADEKSGVITITEVVQDSPAQKAGIKVGENLVALNGVKYNAPKEELHKAYQAYTAGNQVTFTVAASGHERQVKVTLGNLPDEVKARWVGSHLLEQHAQLEPVN